jgi:hypothetical protein
MSLYSQYFLYYLILQLFYEGISPVPITQISESQQIIRFQCQESLSNQIMSVSNAILLSKSLNFSFVLPESFKSRRHNTALIDVTGLQPVRIVKIFNMTKLKSMLSNQYGVYLLRESELNRIHRFYIHQPSIRFSSFEDVLKDLEVFRSLEPIVLDVDNLFLRMITTNCGDQQLLSGILHSLLQTLSDPIEQIVNAIKSELGLN